MTILILMMMVMEETFGEWESNEGIFLHPLKQPAPHTHYILFIIIAIAIIIIIHVIIHVIIIVIIIIPIKDLSSGRNG